MKRKHEQRLTQDTTQAAAAYLIDPLNAPQPADETGPGTHFGSTFDPAHRANAPALPKTSTGGSSSSNNPYRKSIDKHGTPEKTGASSHTRAVSGASNGGRRRSPREEFPNYRAEAFGDFEPAPRSRSGSHGKPPPSYEHATGSAPGSPKGHRRRTSSLNQRYPGDESTEPLDRIRRDSLRAHRSPHLRKKHQPGADTIDRLDPAIGGRAYHHEGPYDAALLARNTSYKSSPVAALQNSNEEALKATPQENVKDSLDRHKPLDGVAVVPPGMPDRFGRTYNYEEGADLMHEDNPDGPGYKRWGGKVRDIKYSACTRVPLTMPRNTHQTILRGRVSHPFLSTKPTRHTLSTTMVSKWPMAISCIETASREAHWTTVILLTLPAEKATM